MQKRYIFFFIASTVLAAYLHVFYYDQLQTLMWLLLGLFAILLLALVLFGCWYIAERIRMGRAIRLQMEKEAHVYQVTDGTRTWIRDTDKNASWHSLHLEQRVYSNGVYQQPTAEEKEAWRIFTRPTRIVSEPATPLLEAPKKPLMQYLDEAQRCLIVGGSGSGKTTVLQHLVEMKQNSSIYIIDPHAYPQKWNGNIVGLGRNYAAIAETLLSLVELMNSRYVEISQGRLDHPPVTIIIDEWRSITHNLPDAAEAIRTLLTESRKANFSIYVASHSDRAKPLGLQGEYDLKEGFTVVRLSFKDNQHIAMVESLGKEQVPAALPGSFLGYSEGLEAAKVELPQITPNTLEQQIIDLSRDGMKPTPIAEAVYGSKGGKQVRQVKDILARFTS